MKDQTIRKVLCKFALNFIIIRSVRKHCFRNKRYDLIRITLRRKLLIGKLGKINI